MNGLWLDTTKGLGQRGRVDEARARTREGVAFLEVQGMRVRVLRRPAPGKPRVLFAADGPNTLEHYDALLAQLAGRADVTVFDPPGTGCSEPGPRFGFSVLEFAAVLQGVLAQVVPAPEKATLVLPCYTGMFGLAAATVDASRVERLVLSQTPSFRAFAAWAERVDPKRRLRTPVLGQLLMALRRRAVAALWFRTALGDRSRVADFVARADEAFAAGGCYCLASLMQRWGSEPPPPVDVAALSVTAAWGQADRSHRGTAADSVRAHAAHAKVELFEACGHSPELEDPKGFIERVLFPV